MEVIGSFENYDNEKIVFKKLRLNRKSYGQYEIELAQFDVTRWLVKPAVLTLAVATITSYLLVRACSRVHLSSGFVNSSVYSLSLAF